MKSFKKKAVIIHATQLINNNFRSLDDIPISVVSSWRAGTDAEGFYVIIPTLEGELKARNNDWIIRGVKGEYYPCKPDIFALTYEETTDETDKVKADNSDKDFNGLLKVGKGTFGMAIEAAKQGFKVARTGWNGSGMFAYIVPANSYPAQTGVAKEHFGENAMVPYRAYWALKTAQDDVATWSPSGSDSLAEDWIVVE